MAETLNRLHANGIVHNDIKYNNICLKERDEGGEEEEGPVVTIIDFGIASKIGHQRAYAKNTMDWLAPELSSKRGA